MTYRTPSPLTFAAVLLAALAAGCDSPTKSEPRDPVGSVHLPTAAADVAVGRTVQLAVEVRDTLDLPFPTAPVTWSSSAEGVATVDGSGVVRGVAPGIATITAKAGKKKATSTVYVSRPYAVVLLAAGEGESRATAINELGHVVGYSTVGYSTGSWLWKDGAVQDLGNFVPSDVNDRGQVVGGRGGEAVLWENGTLTVVYDLNTEPNLSHPYRWARASAINERGDVAGNWMYGYGTRHFTFGSFVIDPVPVP